MVAHDLEGQSDQDRRKVVSHGRYIISSFQLAEVAIARQMFQEIWRLIAQLRPQPPPALRALDRRSASKCQKNGQIRPSTSVRVTRGDGSGQHLGSVLQKGRENTNIDAGLRFIWRIWGIACPGASLVGKDERHSRTYSSIRKPVPVPSQMAVRKCRHYESRVDCFGCGSSVLSSVGCRGKRSLFL